MKRFLLNPISMFMSVWCFVIIGDYIFEIVSPGEFFPISAQTYLLLSLIFICWVLGSMLANLIPSYIYNVKFSIDSRLARSPNKMLIVFLVVMFFSLILIMYDHYLISGANFYLPVGIVRYRVYLTMDGGSSHFPWLSIFNYFFFFAPAVLVSSSFSGFKINRILMVFVVVLYIVFVYFSTARSAVFISFLVAFFIYIHYSFKLRYLILAFFFLLLMFGLIGALVGKSGFDRLWFYLISPFHAFDLIYQGLVNYNPGLLSFRFFQPLFVKLGFLSSSLWVLPDIYTPKATNVFTVLGVYYLDFGVIGLFIFMFIFAFLTGFFYNAARYRCTSRAVFLVSVLYVSTLLGVFYDYYTSSFVIWSAFIYAPFFFPSFKRSL